MSTPAERRAALGRAGTEPVQRVRQVGTVEEHRISYDSSSGQICPNCDVFIRDIDSLQADLKLKNRKIRELEATTDKRAENSEWWVPGRELFRHWTVVTNHRNSLWTPDRFRLIEPFLKKKKYGAVLCRRAIDGAAFESWVTERRNGTLEVHNSWESIFKDAGSLEKHVNRAPRGWSLAYSVELESWPPQKPPATAVKSMWGISPPAGWSPPARETSTGQVTLVSVAE